MAKTIIPGRITDEITTCDCCGRVDLKATVEMQVLDADGIVVALEHYGRTCAKKYYRNTKPENARAKLVQHESEGQYEYSEWTVKRGRATIGTILRDNATIGDPEPYSARTPTGKQLGYFSTCADAMAAIVAAN